MLSMLPFKLQPSLSASTSAPPSGQRSRTPSMERHQSVFYRDSCDRRRILTSMNIDGPTTTPFKAPPPKPPGPGWSFDGTSVTIDDPCPCAHHDAVVRFYWALSGEPVKYEHGRPLLLSCSFMDRWEDVMHQSWLYSGMKLQAVRPTMRPRTHVLALCGKTKVLDVYVARSPPLLQEQ